MFFSSASVTFSSVQIPFSDFQFTWLRLYRWDAQMPPFLGPKYIWELLSGRLIRFYPRVRGKCSFAWCYYMYSRRFWIYVGSFPVFLSPNAKWGICEGACCYCAQGPKGCTPKIIINSQVSYPLAWSWIPFINSAVFQDNKATTQVPTFPFPFSE